MKKWEYYILRSDLRALAPLIGKGSTKWVLTFEGKEYDSPTNKWGIMNKLGKKGWELTSSSRNEYTEYLYFKRPLPEEDVKEDIVLKETTHEEFLERPGGNLPPEG